MIDGKLFVGKFVAPPIIEVKMLDIKLRSLFNYISVTCGAKIEEYDKQRHIFEAVIKSIDVPY